MSIVFLKFSIDIVKISLFMHIIPDSNAKGGVRQMVDDCSKVLITRICLDEIEIEAPLASSPAIG